MAEEESWKNERVLDEIIQGYTEKFKRPGSAPPTSLYFLNDNDYAEHFRTNFMEIRQCPEYEEFYKANCAEKGSPGQLPPPVDLLQIPAPTRHRRLSTVDSIDVEEEGTTKPRKSSFTLDKITENMNQIIDDEDLRPNDEKGDDSPIKNLESHFASMTMQSCGEEQKTPPPQQQPQYYFPTPQGYGMAAAGAPFQPVQFNVHVHPPAPAAYPWAPFQMMPGGPIDLKLERKRRNEFPMDMTVEQVKEVLEQPLKVGLDQGGCRMLQAKLDDPELAGPIVQAIAPIIADLFTAQFGNYLVQKIFERADEHLLEKCIIHLKGNELEICSNSHGTRTVQKLVAVCAHFPRLVVKVRDLIRPNVVRLVQDINGNHVVQKCLQDFQPEDSQFVYDEFLSGCQEIATHKHGCCVLQKCINKADKRNREKLIDTVVNLTPRFVKDPFANYVVQFLLEKKDYVLNRKIALKLQGSYLGLSTEKFSSNVIEKCLEFNSQQTQDQIVLELLEATSYLEILKNNYGNYVIQKALNAASPPLFHRLASRLRPEMAVLKASNDFAHKIYHKLVRNYPQLAVNDPAFKTPPKKKSHLSKRSFPSSPSRRDQQAKTPTSAKNAAPELETNGESPTNRAYENFTTSAPSFTPTAPAFTPSAAAHHPPPFMPSGPPPASAHSLSYSPGSMSGYPSGAGMAGYSPSSYGAYASGSAAAAATGAGYGVSGQGGFPGGGASTYGGGSGQQQGNVNINIHINQQTPPQYHQGFYPSGYYYWQQPPPFNKDQ